ncbi:MAG: hypothetical protein ACYDAR_20870 [Thermomicrobiales bacterium]
MKSTKSTYPPNNLPAEERLEAARLARIKANDARRVADQSVLSREAALRAIKIAKIKAKKAAKAARTRGR